MSMIGNYRRVSRAKLDELLRQPEHLSPFLYPEEESDPDRHLDIDKTWHIIHFLLTGSTWEGSWPLVGVVMGGEAISEEDVGYGPARYLTPMQVREVSGSLASISSEALWSRFDAGAARQAEIYPEHWTGEADDRDYVQGYYKDLQDFFAAAAQAEEAMIIYLN